MKALTAQTTHFLRKETTRKNLKTLVRLLLVLAAIVVVYSVIFHVLMMREGREFSWFTGVYWTLTVMSTLGFGDITFESDLGRVFSMMVLLTGTVYMLILLPFSFIRFFYAPWMEAQSEARAVRQVPKETSGHVLLTHHDAVSSTLIHKLTQYHYPYFLLTPTLGEALRLHDAGLKVVMGDLDNPEVYREPAGAAGGAWWPPRPATPSTRTWPSRCATWPQRCRSSPPPTIRLPSISSSWPDALTCCRYPKRWASPSRGA